MPWAGAESYFVIAGRFVRVASILNKVRRLYE
jgi:hypothetical protein